MDDASARVLHWWSIVMRRLPTLLGLAVVYAGCVGTSVPQPPNHDPIDPDLVAGDIFERGGDPFLMIGGRVGAAKPGAELWIWDLETAEPPVVVAIDSAGAFVASIPEPAGELRMQTRDDEGRSEPTDLIIGSDASVPSPREDCFDLARELIFDGRGAELQIENRCSVEVTLVDTRLRMTDAFDVERVTELRMPPGARAMIRIDAPGTEPVEDILFLTMDIRGSPLRYPVTISAL